MRTRGRGWSAPPFDSASQANPAPIRHMDNGFSAACRPRLRTKSPPPLSLAYSIAWSTSCPGVIRSRSSPSVTSSSLRVSSASRSSCLLSSMILSRLLLGDGNVALKLMEGFARHECFRLEPANSDEGEDQPDQQRHAADDQCRIGLCEPVLREGGDRRLQENDQGGNQENRASDHESQAGCHRRDLLRQLGSGELSFFAKERRQLGHKVREEFGNAASLHGRHRSPCAPELLTNRVSPNPVNMASAKNATGCRRAKSSALLIHSSMLSSRSADAADSSRLAMPYS